MSFFHLKNYPALFYEGKKDHLTTVQDVLLIWGVGEVYFLLCRGKGYLHHLSEN